MDVDIKQYEDLVNELKTLKQKYNDRRENYKKSLQKNPYLGKIIGDYYITSAGVKRKINDKLTRCNADLIGFIPGTEDLLNNLPIGDPMDYDESCGYEGKNIIVAPFKLQSTPTGCFLNKELNDNFVSIGPKQNNIEQIINGNFYLPKIKPNSYQTLSSIPGWTGNFALLNNARDWWYPPNILQVVNLQKQQYIQQYITIPNNAILKIMACGRPNYGPNTISISYNGQQLDSITPSTNWETYTIQIKNGGINKLLIIKGTNTTDLSTAITSISISDSIIKSTYISHDKCKETAMLNGSTAYTYDTNGYCMISNPGYVIPSNISIPIIWGEPIKLWTSNTPSQGASVSLSKQGELIVWDVSDNPVFKTTGKNTLDFVGCYGDRNKRAMNLVNGGSRNFTKESCMQEANKSLSSYYALQWYDGHEFAQCSVSNDIDSIKQYGPATNCLFDSFGNQMGSDWSNAVFSANPGGKEYFLIVEDSGNMSIYLGSSPSDKGSQIPLWESNTKITNVIENTSKNSSNSFNSKNWMSSNDINKMSMGQFIGSPKGYVYLILEPSGNLVLYSNSSLQGCQGDNLTTTMYSIPESSPWASIGKAGTVDSTGKIVKSKSFIDEFYKIIGTIWDDGQGTKINTNNEASCQSECIKNPLCSEYSFSQNSGCRLNATDNPITAFKYDPLQGVMAKRKQDTLFDNVAPFEVSATMYNGYDERKELFNILNNIDPEGLAHIEQLESRILDLAQRINKQAKPNQWEKTWNSYYDKFFKASSNLQTEIDHIDDQYIKPDNNEMQYIYVCAIAIIILLAAIISISYLN
jgi:hypothetical protein